MSENNNVSLISYFENTNKESFDILKKLSQDHIIIRDAMLAIDQKILTPIEALTGCIYSLAMNNKNLSKRLSTLSQRIPSLKSIILKSKEL